MWFKLHGFEFTHIWNIANGMDKIASNVWNSIFGIYIQL